MEGFNELLGRRIRELIPVQTFWATCEQVDLNNNTMIAKGVVNGLNYYNVRLGLEGEISYPEQGTMCLLGMINKSKTDCFLIEAKRLVRKQIKLDETVINIAKNGLEIKQGNESLKEVLNDLIDEINKIIVIQGTSINVSAMNLIKQRLNKILKA